MLLTPEIHIRALVGAQIKTYLHSIAKLLAEVCREYPYLQEANTVVQTANVIKAASCKESIAVLIFDKNTLIGASIGLPLMAESIEIQKPFLEKNEEMHNYYFFSASLLLKPYRGRGIGHHFFDVREAHVAHYKKFTHISFCTPELATNDPLRPEDYLPLDDFWRKRGYVHHPEITCHLLWTPVNTQRCEERKMTFWIKKLDLKRVSTN